MIEEFLSEIVAVEHSFPMRDVGVSVIVTWKMRYSTNGTTGAIRLRNHRCSQNFHGCSLVATAIVCNIIKEEYLGIC